jgi:hypothetical protein
MPRRDGRETARERARREVERWRSTGLFTSGMNVNTLTPQHWRAVKETNGRVHIRSSVGDQALPTAERTYPCWIEWAGAYVSVGNITHSRADWLLQEVRNPAHTNTIRGLSVTVQAPGWLTPAEREIARAREREQARLQNLADELAQRAGEPASIRPSEPRRRQLDHLVAAVQTIPLMTLDRWVVGYVINRHGALFCTQHEYTPRGYTFGVFLDLGDGRRIVFADPQPVAAIREFQQIYPSMAIWVRERPSEGWSRFGRPTDEFEVEPSLLSDPWLQAPPTPEATQEAEAMRREHQMWRQQFEAIPRSRRNACRILYDELSRNEQRALGVTIVNSTEDLVARDFVLLSAELGRRALAEEADDDVLNDNKDDYPTESV